MTRSLNALGLVAVILLLVAGGLFFFFREGPPMLVINEIMAGNVSCCPDVSGGREEHDDWIEIYNAGTTPVNIGGMYLSQDKSRPTDHKIDDSHPQLTTIPPGGFLILWADGTPDQGPLHLEFKLDHDGEYIGFFDRHARTIDDYAFAEHPIDASIGRSEDGGGTWKVLTSPTPGRSNQ